MIVLCAGSLARLQSLVNVTQASTGQGAPASSTEARSAEASDNEQTSLQTQLHLAEWSCANISFKVCASCMLSLSSDDMRLQQFGCVIATEFSNAMDSSLED